MVGIAGAAKSGVASADRAEARRVLTILNSSLKLAIARPGASNLPSDTGSGNDFEQPRTLSGSVLREPRGKIVSRADVMLGVFVRRAQMEQIDSFGLHNAFLVGKAGS